MLSDYGTWYLIALGLIAIAAMVWARRGVWGLVMARYDLKFFPVQRRIAADDRKN